MPVILWFGGDAGPARDELIATIAAALTHDAPIGADTVLFGKGVRPDGERLVVAPALDPTFAVLASVVFVSRDHGLWGLDWTIADDAESYYGATNADELMAIIESNSA